MMVFLYKNVCYGIILPLSLTTVIEARQEAGIAFNCGASCLLTFPKWRLTNFVEKASISKSACLTHNPPISLIICKPEIFMVSSP